MNTDRSLIHTGHKCWTGRWTDRTRTIGILKSDALTCQLDKIWSVNSCITITGKVRWCVFRNDPQNIGRLLFRTTADQKSNNGQQKPGFKMFEDVLRYFQHHKTLPELNFQSSILNLYTNIPSWYPGSVQTGVWVLAYFSSFLSRAPQLSRIHETDA